MSPDPRRLPIPLRLLCVACALTLSACGGGGDDEAAADDAIALKSVSADLSAAEAAAESAWIEDEPVSAEAGDESSAAPSLADGDATAGARALRRVKPQPPVPTTPPKTSVPASAPTTAQRAAAAAATAQSAANACAQARPFSWEIGSRDGALASGAVGGGAVDPAAPIAIASASKWIYGAYVAQLRNGAPTAADRAFLTMTAGYASLVNCSGMASVDACLAAGGNGAYTAAWDGVFRYNGGHMERHASLNGLGALSTKALATEVRAKLGTEIALAYSQPLPAGGVVISTQHYATFLRKILGGQLKIASLLGSAAVCTQSAACAGTLSPAPAGENLHYAFGHWVEDDPTVGDGAFSSAGAFGFYPWIDATKTHYGIVARVVEGGGPGSMACGRLIRAAWASGVAR